MLCKNYEKPISNQKLKNSLFMLWFGILIIGFAFPWDHMAKNIIDYIYNVIEMLQKYFSLLSAFMHIYLF